MAFWQRVKNEKVVAHRELESLTPLLGVVLAILLTTMLAILFPEAMAVLFVLGMMGVITFAMGFALAGAVVGLFQVGRALFNWLTNSPNISLDTALRETFTMASYFAAVTGLSTGAIFTVGLGLGIALVSGAMSVALVESLSYAWAIGKVGMQSLLDFLPEIFPGLRSEMVPALGSAHNPMSPLAFVPVPSYGQTMYLLIPNQQTGELSPFSAGTTLPENAAVVYLMPHQAQAADSAMPLPPPVILPPGYGVGMPVAPGQQQQRSFVPAVPASSTNPFYVQHLHPIYAAAPGGIPAAIQQQQAAAAINSASVDSAAPKP